MEGFPGDIIKLKVGGVHKRAKVRYYRWGGKGENEKIYAYLVHLFKKIHRKDKPEINGIGYLQTKGCKEWEGHMPWASSELRTMWAHQSCGVRSARGRQTRRRALSLFRAAGQRADVEEGGVLLQARGPGAPRRLRYSPLGTSPWGSAWPLQKARDPNSQTQAPSPCVQRVSCELRHLYYGGWSLSPLK